MRRRFHTALRTVAGLLMVGMGGPVRAQPFSADTALLRHLRMKATYVRETRDQAWHIRAAGTVPTPPGLYVIVYNERGDIVRHGEIPSGTYSTAAPFLLEVPADGIAQQYVIKLLGVNASLHGITLPMTDLPFEVYEGTFVMPYPVSREIRRLAFRANPGMKKVTFTGGVRNMRVLDAKGAVVADNKTVDELNLTPRPGQTYWLDPGNANQFQNPKGTEKTYLTFDPRRWFFPTIAWDLDSRPWWKGLTKRNHSEGAAALLE